MLEDTTTQLDFRVTTLEENGGSGNSSVGELEVRVDTLEDTVSNHETRLTAGESQLEGMFSHVHKTFYSIEIKDILIRTDFYLTSVDLQTITDELETRLTSAEENIQG